MNFESFAIRFLIFTVVACPVLASHVQAKERSGQPGGRSTDERLRRLEDREEIQQLLMDYGRFLDQRNFAAFSQLFAERDGEWVGGLGSAKGPDAIRKLMESSIGTGKGSLGSPNFHLFTNETIQVTGDSATALTKWIFVVRSADNHPQPYYLGHYDDTFVREKGHWRFLRRVVSNDIPSEDTTTKK